jgi:hypothetical protein
MPTRAGAALRGKGGEGLIFWQAQKGPQTGYQRTPNVNAPMQTTWAGEALWGRRGRSHNKTTRRQDDTEEKGKGSQRSNHLVDRSIRNGFLNKEIGK